MLVNPGAFAASAANWLEIWLKAATVAVRTNYQLGVEILQCRRLVKGYSDTHSRGLSKFDRTLATIKLVEQREDAADWARPVTTWACESFDQLW